VSTERWRFVGTQDVVQLFFAVTSGTLLFWLAVALLPLQPAIPRSVIALEWMLTVYLTAGLWLSYRLGFENLRHREAGFNGSAKRVIIVGAGEAGNRLAREMRSSPTGYRPIGVRRRRSRHVGKPGAAARGAWLYPRPSPGSPRNATRRRS
jgi:FlaA1/EpsC-like NDP-sugar epimerase